MSAIPAPPAAIRQPAKNRSLFARLWRNRMARVGMFISAVVVLAALFGPALAPYDPVALNLADRLTPPSAEPPTGADHLRRDILTPVL